AHPSSLRRSRLGILRWQYISAGISWRCLRGAAWLLEPRAANRLQDYPRAFQWRKTHGRLPGFHHWLEPCAQRPPCLGPASGSIGFERWLHADRRRWRRQNLASDVFRSPLSAIYLIQPPPTTTSPS